MNAPSVGPNYTFTSCWFGSFLPEWLRAFEEAGLLHAPNVSYLEVGVYEGRSLFWMMENVLTHPSSRATAVDLWSPEYEPRFLANLVMSGYADRITIKKGRSNKVLRGLSHASFDIVYLDGSHSAQEALADLVYGWDVLKPGGILIFDDYGQDEAENHAFPKDGYARLAMDAFLTAYGKSYAILLKNYQVILRKNATRWPDSILPEDDDEPLTHCHIRLGPYVYYFLPGVKRMSNLEAARGAANVPLSNEEVTVLDKFVAHLPFTYDAADHANPVRQDAAFKALMTRLGIPSFAAS